MRVSIKMLETKAKILSDRTGKQYKIISHYSGVCLVLKDGEGSGIIKISPTVPKRELLDIMESIENFVIYGD